MPNLNKKKIDKIVKGLSRALVVQVIEEIMDGGWEDALDIEMERVPWQLPEDEDEADEMREKIKDEIFSKFVSMLRKNLNVKKSSYK